MVFGAIECSPPGASNDFHTWSHKKNNDVLTPKWMFGLKLSRLYILSVGIRVYLPGLAPQWSGSRRQRASFAASSAVCDRTWPVLQQKTTAVNNNNKKEVSSFFSGNLSLFLIAFSSDNVGRNHEKKFNVINKSLVNNFEKTAMRALCFTLRYSLETVSHTWCGAPFSTSKPKLRNARKRAYSYKNKRRRFTWSISS